MRWARVAEDTGFDAVMISEHVVLGPDASANGVMGNPRDYAMPGNQDPEMPWPNSLMLLSAMASVTQRLRLVAGAIIAPLRHPLLLARELGTLDLISEGRLVVQPTVSWSRDEYAALGVPFTGAARSSTSSWRSCSSPGRADRSPTPASTSRSRTSALDRAPTAPTDRGCGSGARA